MALTPRREFTEPNPETPKSDSEITLPAEKTLALGSEPIQLPTKLLEVTHSILKLMQEQYPPATLIDDDVLRERAIVWSRDFLENGVKWSRVPKIYTMARASKRFEGDRKQALFPPTLDELLIAHERLVAQRARERAEEEQRQRSLEMAKREQERKGRKVVKGSKIEEGIREFCVV